MPEPPNYPQRRGILSEIHQDLQIQRIAQVPGDYNQINKEFEARNKGILRSLRRIREQQSENVAEDESPTLFATESQFVHCENTQCDEERQHLLGCQISPNGTRVVTLPQEDQDKIDAMHVRLDNHEKELEYRRAIRAAELESGQLDEVPDEKSSTEDIDHTNDEKIQPSGLKNFIRKIVTKLDLFPRNLVVFGFAATATTFTLVSLVLWSFKYLAPKEDLTQIAMFPNSSEMDNNTLIVKDLIDSLSNYSVPWDGFRNYTNMF